ncbi:MAG: ABC transporter substrate-binding protein [Acidimicrobiales bacterium]|nr:ABC transporter substrate-binding protein [Acidimicrobiales bacterium]
MDRRQFLRGAAATALAMPAVTALSACSDQGTGTSSAAGTLARTGGGATRKVKLGFISLTDCAPLVVALEKGFFAERGLDVTLENGKSWPTVRDKLASGEFQAAHALFSLPLSVAAGLSKVEVSGIPERPFRIAMMLNNNGQGITLANDLATAGYGDPGRAAEVIRSTGARQFGMTFPGGTHDIWLRYWMAAGGLDPKKDGLELKPIPPPDMFNNLNQENVRGYCVGEPWNARAVTKQKGFTVMTSQDIWEHHPEKALLVNTGFAENQRETLTDLMGALLAAQRWADDPANTDEVAQLIGVEKYVNATPDEISRRLAGEYDLGANAGSKTFSDTRMRFFRDGLTPFPRRAHALWFFAQYARLGMIPSMPENARGIVDEIVMTDLYAEVAAREGVPVPDDDLAPFTVNLDNATFDPAHPEEEVNRR